MTSLTIKNVPQEVLDRLRAVAVRNRRSVNQQAIQILDDATRAAPEDRAAAVRAEIEAQARVWRSLVGAWASDRPLEEEIAAIYAARTAGRQVDL